MGKVEKTKRYSIREGIFAAGAGSFGGYYISPFAIAINSSNFLVAIMKAVGGLFGPLSQIFGSRLIGKVPRKKYVMNLVLLESLMWIPFFILAFLYFMGVYVSYLP